ncbi:MAG: Crp/Fnr family transcriptional regulator [bacterium]
MARTPGPECALCRARGACFFSDLGGEQFEDFKRSRISNVYKKRQVVFYEGHMPHGIFIVCAGSVKIYKSDSKGHQLTTRLAHQGDILGYRALLSKEPYSATAEAMEDSCLAYIEEAKFREFLAKHQVLALKMLTKLAQDVRLAEDKARDMAMKSSRERLVELLVMLRATYGTPSKEGVVLKMPFTRLDLAELAGLAQETVIRLLTELEEKKIIMVKGRSVTILNEKALEKHAVVT